MEDCSINQLFLFDVIDIYPFNNDECLAFNPRNNKKVRLSFNDAENALSCLRFLTLEEHIDNILETKPNLKQERVDIELSLKRMLNEGLMITPREVLNILIEPSPRLTTVCKHWKDGWNLAICSADRPELVSRLLATITPHLLELTTKPLLLLIDDSRSLSSSEQNHQSIQKYCKENKLEYEFWDRKRRIEFCNTLNESLPDCVHSIRYLLSAADHPVDINTIGQARNFAVLRSIDKPLLMLDDDCLVEPVEDDLYESSFNLGYSGRKGIVKSSYNQLFASLNNSSVNPFYEHLSLLGETLQSTLLKGGTNVLTPSFWRNKTKEVLVNLNRSSFIGLSVNSIAGALNSRQMDWFFHLEGDDLQHAAAFLESLDNDIEEKEKLSIAQATWNGRPYDEISRNIPFIGTTICGIAALPIVPPMPPIGRNEDLALGAIVNFLYKDAYTYQMGWGLPHLPDPIRQWQPYEKQQEPEYNSTSFYISLLFMLDESCPYTEPEDRLNYLSMYLKKLSDEEAISLIKETSYGHHTHMIEVINNSHKNTIKYPKYQQGCKQMISYHLDELSNILSKLPKLQGEVQDLTNYLNIGLSDWPSIWSYCRTNMVFDHV